MSESLALLLLVMKQYLLQQECEGSEFSQLPQILKCQDVRELGIVTAIHKAVVTTILV
jgi:hypothetical protein